MSVFTDNIINIHGEIGRNWLNNLNETVTYLSDKWNLQNLISFENLTYNFVLHGVQNNIPIVLKIGIEYEILEKEAQWLKFFENYGAVKLIDFSKGALLLQRAVPGNSLIEYFSNKEDEAITITANVIKKLHSADAVINIFSNIEEATRSLYKNLGIPSCYIFKAQQFAEHLQKSTERQVALHGDLHHDNIVRHENDWKVIDPAGIIGDSAYEIASFIINPIDRIWKHKNAVPIVKNRIDKFSNLLNIDPTRIVQWAFVKSVLCWIWDYKTYNMDRLQLVKLMDSIT